MVFCQPTYEFDPTRHYLVDISGLGGLNRCKRAFRAPSNEDGLRDFKYT